MTVHHIHGAGGSPECALCPVCVLLQAFTTGRPEVTGHLLSAGRELSLAMAKAFEASAEAFERAAAAHADREEAAPPGGAPDTPAPRLQRVRVD